MTYSLNWALKCSWKFFCFFSALNNLILHYFQFSLYNSRLRSNKLPPHSYPTALPTTLSRIIKAYRWELTQLPDTFKLTSIHVHSVTLEKLSMILSKVYLPVLWILVLPIQAQRTISHFFAFLEFPHISTPGSPSRSKKISQIHIPLLISRPYIVPPTIKLWKNFLHFLSSLPYFQLSHYNSTYLYTISQKPASKILLGRHPYC